MKFFLINSHVSGCRDATRYFAWPNNNLIEGNLESKDSKIIIPAVGNAEKCMVRDQKFYHYHKLQLCLFQEICNLSADCFCWTLSLRGFSWQILF